MSNHTTLSSLFDDIAAAIRDKDGTSESIVADTFPERIAAIDTDPSGDATATAADILSPKTAYAGGQKLTGTMPTMTLPTSTVTATPAGTNKLTIGRDTSTRYLAIPAGYNSAAAYYTISAVANMTAPSAVSSNYTGTSRLTINTSTSTQYLNLPVGYNATAYYYTIRPVTHTATAAKIAAGQTVNIGDAGNATRIAGITGTYTSDATAAATDILDGKTAYVNGSKITGSIANATITNNTTLPSGSTSSGTINRGSYIKIGAGYNSIDKYYLAQADAHSSYTPNTTYFSTSTTNTVSTAKIEANKYATSTYYVKQGSFTVSAGEDYIATPVISKQTISISGVTDAANGDATTTAPSSGVYVKVKSAADTGTVSYVKSATAGWINSESESAHIAGYGGANASADTYIPINTASPAFKGGDISGSVSGVTGSNVILSDTDNGISVKSSASAFRGAVRYNGAVSGWVTMADNAVALAGVTAVQLTSKTKYITSITVPKDVSFSLSATADTALDTTSNIDIINAAYRHVKVTNGANGSTTITNSGLAYVNSGSATAGSLTVSAYNSGGTAENSKAVVTNGKWVSTEVTPGAAQGPFYGRVTVKAASAGTAATFEVSGASVKTTSSGAGYVAANTTVGTVASMTLPTATITSGQSGTNKLTINRATGTRYLQIPAGYNSAAAYYTISGVADMTLPTAASSTSSGTAKATIAPSTSAQYLNIPTGYNTAASYYTISAMPTSTITNNTTLPSGSTSSGTINRGSYIKIGAGYVSADTYYLAQADAHSSYTPSSTYFKTSTTGAISAAKIEANKYATSAYYVKSATPAFDGGAVSGSVSVASSTMTLANDDPNGIRLSITGSGTATRAAVLYNGAVAGWVDKADNATALAAGSATALTGATKYITNINVPAGKTLHLTGATGTDSNYSSIFVDSAGNYSYIDITGSGSDTYVKLSDGSSRYGSLNVTDSTTNTNGGTSWSAGSATSGYLMASGYNSSGTAEMYKNLIVGGKWVSTEVTPSTSAQGPFYGRVNVKAATMASVSVSGTAMTITGGIVQMN